MDSNCEVTPRPKSLKELLKSRIFWKPFLGIFVGGLGGFLYFYFVGCKTGSCAITSNPLSSIITGSVFGLFIISSPCRSC